MDAAGTKRLRSPRMTMEARSYRVFVATLVAAAATTAAAEDSAARTSQIYQQRGADGGIVLSDRPIPGVAVQRSWSIVADDPVAARARREQGRIAAEAVSERIQRQLDLDRQRADTAEADRLRLSLAQARREAEVAREAARETTIVYAPRWHPPSLHRQPTHRPGRTDGSRSPQRRGWPDPGP